MSDRKSRFEPLDEGNHHVWKKFMKATLIKKGVWEIVDGTVTRPLGSVNSAAVRSFLRKQAEAIAEITLNVSASQLAFINSDDPAVVWEELEHVHQARGVASRLTLRRRFWKLQKADSQSMQAFIGEARKLAFQLTEIGVTVEDEEMILVLTGGLPASYDHLVVSLDATDPTNLTIDYVINRLINEEARQTNSDPDRAKGTLNIETAYAARARRPIEQITCYKCGNKGHYQVNCPELKKAATESAPATAATALADADDIW
jgi:hypothetical protein